MVPASALNALRRDAMESLTRLRAMPPQRRHLSWQYDFTEEAHCPAPVLTVSVRTFDQITSDLLACKPAVIYFPMEGAQKQGALIAQMLECGIEPCVTLPRVLWDREVKQAEQTLSALKELGVTTALVGNLSGVRIAKRAGLVERGDFGLEVYNSVCADRYRALGLCSLTLSFEQRLARIRDQRKVLPSEIIVYGRLPLMITQNCIYRARDGKCTRSCEARSGMVDRKKARFPVLRAYGCRNEIFNAVPLWLVPQRSELEHSGAWALRLNFVTETPEECVRVMDAYLGRGDYVPASYTRGLYYRDVE